MVFKVVSLSPEDYRDLIPYFKLGRRFFDSSSSILVTSTVIEEIRKFYESGNVRRNSGVYPGTYESTRVIEETRENLSKILNVSNYKIAFPSNVSLGIFYAISILYQKNRNSYLIYTNDLSNDILIPVRYFINKNACNAIQLDIKDTPEKWLEILQTSFNDIEIILILPLFSLSGESYQKNNFVNKLRKIFSIKLIIDAIISGGIFLSYLSKFEADLVIFDSNIGWGGPIGQGILMFKDYPVNVPLLLQGSGTVQSVTYKDIILLETNEKFETAINPAVLHGLNASINLIQPMISKMSDYIIHLNKTFRKKISEINQILILNNSINHENTPITSFIIPEINSHEVAVYLDELSKIDIRSGYFCAHQLVDQLTKGYKTDGILQVCFYYYNTISDVDHFCHAIDNCVKLFSK
ncbi:MAG: putative cysteine desulfurase [Candidatus Heimdallarchaeota archaeon LC_3]|nr:MAG: putative cysteine desulfurase [Candidatus Heimdallarchaeota archaeon LC_3]